MANIIFIISNNEKKIIKTDYRPDPITIAITNEHFEQLNEVKGKERGKKWCNKNQNQQQQQQQQQ